MTNTCQKRVKGRVDVSAPTRVPGPDEIFTGRWQFPVAESVASALG